MLSVESDISNEYVISSRQMHNNSVNIHRSNLVQKIAARNRQNEFHNKTTLSINTIKKH